MTIVFRLPPAAAERVAFSYSPALEAVLRLHVLAASSESPTSPVTQVAGGRTTLENIRRAAEQRS